MTAKQARLLSQQYLQEDREYVDGKIRESCGRGHYRVWVQEHYLSDASATKDYYKSMGFEIKGREGGSIKEFLISWEGEVMNKAINEGQNQFERIMDMLGIGGHKDSVEKSYEVSADNLCTIFRLKCVDTITKRTDNTGNKRTVVLLSNGMVAHTGERIVKLKNGKWEVR